jgi:hypothetical protein
MKSLNSRSLTVASLVAGAACLTFLTVGCGSDSASGTGGKGGSTTGTGGKATDGGGTGGMVGSTGGSDAGTVTHTISYTFTTVTDGVQGFGLNTYNDPTSTNLAAVIPMDGGTDAASNPDAGAGSKPMVSWDSVEGSPSPGSVKVAVTFTGYKQYVDVVINPPTPGINLMGKTLHAQMKLTSGMFSGGAQFHASTGDYTPYKSAPVPALVLGTWNSVALDLTGPPPANWDATKVVQIGIQIFSGDPVADAGTYPNAGVPVVFNIDTITD